jgi:hypothetical protein
MADVTVATEMKLEDAPAVKPVETPIVTTPETPEVETREKAVNPRDAAMARIAEGRQAQLDKELLYADDMATADAERLHIEAPDAAILEADAAKPLEVKPADKPVIEAPAVVEPPRRNIQIGNQTFAVTEAELEQLAIYGAQSLAQPSQQPQQQFQLQQVVQQPTQQPILDDETAKAIAKRIAFGDEEDGAKALQDLVTGVLSRVPQVRVPSVDQVAQAAIPVIQARQQFTDNLSRIGQEFEDIFSDNGLSTLAGMEARNLREKYALLRQDKPDLEVYREACKAVRDKYVAPRQSQSGPGPTETAVQAAPVRSMSDRIESKRAVPRPPASAGRTASLGIDQNRPPTGSEIVNRMRQARGQPAYN